MVLAYHSRREHVSPAASMRFGHLLPHFGLALPPMRPIGRIPPLPGGRARSAPAAGRGIVPARGGCTGRRASATGWACAACGAARATPWKRCFPPWLLPYEELPVASLDPLLPAAGTGASWATVAAQTGAAPVAVRRRWRRWGPQGPGLRQRVLQPATRRGISLAWPTWRAPAGARSVDWGWLGLAWAALAVIFLPGVASGMGVWVDLTAAPWPAAVVPARTHLGRRVRAVGVPP